MDIKHLNVVDMNIKDDPSIRLLDKNRREAFVFTEWMDECFKSETSTTSGKEM